MANLLRTGVLIAALTALFMAVGYFIGGQSGMLVALVIALGMNLFAYWNSDKMVLSLQNAHEVDPRQAPDLYRMIETLAGRAGRTITKIRGSALGCSATVRCRDRRPSAIVPEARYAPVGRFSV